MSSMVPRGRMILRIFDGLILLRTSNLWIPEIHNPSKTTEEKSKWRPVNLMDRHPRDQELMLRLLKDVKNDAVKRQAT